MSNLAVANAIKNQLGGGALFMLGAKNLAGDDTSLSFTIGKNAGRWTKIRIKLNALDLYDVEFMRVERRKDPQYGIKLPQIVKYGVHTDTPVDMLHAMIESATGMATSLTAHYSDYQQYEFCSTDIPKEFVR